MLGIPKVWHGIDGCQSTKICGRSHPRIHYLSWATGNCIRKDRDGKCAEGYHLGMHIKKDKDRRCADGYHLGNARTHILKELRDIPEKPAEGPITQDANTRGERNVTKEPATQGDRAGITTLQGTLESQLEAQETQDTNKGGR